MAPVVLLVGPVDAARHAAPFAGGERRADDVGLHGPVAQPAVDVTALRHAARVEGRLHEQGRFLLALVAHRRAAAVAPQHRVGPRQQHVVQDLLRAGDGFCVEVGAEVEAVDERDFLARLDGLVDVIEKRRVAKSVMNVAEDKLGHK